MVKSEEINENPDDDASEEDKKLPAKRKRTLSAKAAVNNSIEDSDSEYKDEPPAKKQRKVKAKKVGRGRQNNLKNGTRSSKALPLDAMVRSMLLRLLSWPKSSNVSATGHSDGVPVAKGHAELLQHVQVPPGDSDNPDGRRFRVGSRRVRPSVNRGATKVHGRQITARPIAFAPAANLQWQDV
mmetsp:Transcript_31588/g.70730  ORF Transcript_31588/g.70730 Transcript_31588/m.70730 type:complete len:183 (-) Transcript_31588:4694-5242(-)